MRESEIDDGPAAVEVDAHADLSVVDKAHGGACGALRAAELR